MKTLICSIFFLAITWSFVQAQPTIKGTTNVISHSNNNSATFVEKEVHITRKAIENLDTMFIPNEMGNAQIFVTDEGVYIVADKPSKTVSYGGEPKSIVVDLDQAKQANELMNPTPENSNIVMDAVDDGFNVQNNNRIDAIKTNIQNKIDLSEDLKNRSLIDIREENIIGFIFFKPNSATIQQEYYAELYKLNYLLEQMPDVKLMLIGHSDIEGSEFQNKTIARSRAQAVYHFLVGILKMDADRFEVYGEEKNIYDVPDGETIYATNPSQKNRSVTLIIK